MPAASTSHTDGGRCPRTLPLERRFEALVFDCDGVVLDSARLKRQAFLALYRDEPAAEREAIRAYLARGGGQPRVVKFQHIETQILGRAVTKARLQALSQRFRRHIDGRMARVPLLPGALDCLVRWHSRCPLYLLSATPQSELRALIAARGLSRWFIDVLGAPPDKPSGLTNLMAARGHAAARSVMIGDSYNDYRAARSATTHFVGIVGDEATPPFPAHCVTAANLGQLDAALACLPPA